MENKWTAINILLGAKKRALVYVDAGHLPQAVASFGSDMANHLDIIPDLRGYR
jgi:hypothetical protein